MLFGIPSHVTATHDLLYLVILCKHPKLKSALFWDLTHFKTDTFRDNVSVKTPVVLDPWKWGRQFVPKRG